MFFRACSVEDFDLRRSRVAVLAGTLVSDDAGVGRSAPLHPLGDGVREGSHPLALSRGCSVGGFGFRRNRRAVNFSLRHFCFRGGLHENFVPDRTGARRVAFIGAFAFAAVLAGISFSTARDVGRSDPLHPLGDGVREGSHPLALSRGVAGRSQVRRTPRARPQNFDHPRFFPAPPGVREGSHPLALSHGVARRGQVC